VNGRGHEAEQNPVFQFKISEFKEIVRKSTSGVAPMITIRLSDVAAATGWVSYNYSAHKPVDHG
jgi:hypothetical protein